MSEKNYVVNVKTPKGTIFTVRADTAEELNQSILDVITNSTEDRVLALEELMTGVKTAPPQTFSAPSAQPDPVALLTETFGATVISETPVAQAPAFAPVPPPPVAPVATAVVGARTCQHGPMVTRKGSGAKGEWKGYFCPTPKGTPGQCDPQWLTKRDPEWNTF